MKTERRSADWYQQQARKQRGTGCVVDASGKVKRAVAFEPIRINVPMRAVGKARPRVTKRGTFMDAGYVAWKRELQMRVGHAMPPVCRVSIVAQFKMPQSWSKIRRAASCDTPRNATPDADNVAGAIMDALWEDDSGVHIGKVDRVWGESDAIMIVVEAV